jgi:hypothetical protein
MLKEGSEVSKGGVINVVITVGGDSHRKHEAVCGRHIFIYEALPRRTMLFLLLVLSHFQFVFVAMQFCYGLAVGRVYIYFFFISLILLLFSQEKPYKKNS